MSRNSILLVDPRSVRHGPPPKILDSDKVLSALYSDALDRCVCKKLASVNKPNANAVRAKYMSSYGMLMLGGVLREKGYDVRYINGDYYPDKDTFFCDVEKLADNYDLICFSAVTPQYPECVELANKIQGKRTVLGGPHSYFFKNHKERTPFSLICTGHNIMQAASKIIDFIEDKTQDDVFHTSGYSDVKKDFTLIPQEYLRETLLYSYTSFGCPNDCRYCVERKFNRNVCYFDAEKTIEEIAFLVNEAGVRLVHLADSDFFLNADHAKKVIDSFVSAKLSCCFSVNVSPKTICSEKTLPLIKLFCKAGLVEILVGTEYFSYDVLKVMNKHYDIQLFFNAMMKLRQALPDLLVSFYSLVGLPGSSYKAIEENRRWNKKFFDSTLFDYSFPKMFVPYPGTDVYENPEQFSARILHNKWEEYHRWFLPRPIALKGITDSDIMNELLIAYSLYSK